MFILLQDSNIVSNVKLISGFSLIELCIVLMIISLMTIFIYPSYQQIITKSHRVDGKLALIDLALRLDRYFTQNNTYATATIATGKGTDLLASNLSVQGFYRLTIVHATVNKFVIAAEGLNSKYDKLCHTLVLDNLGQQSVMPKQSNAITLQCWS